MSAEDWIYDFDPYDDYAYEGRTCDYCGKKGLEWNIRDDKWFLTDGNGRKHMCRNKISAETEFDDLT